MGLDIYFYCCIEHYDSLNNDSCTDCCTLGLQNSNVRIVDHFPHPNFRLRLLDGCTVYNLIIKLQEHSKWIIENMETFKYPNISNNTSSKETDEFTPYWLDTRSHDKINLLSDYVILQELIYDIIHCIGTDKLKNYIVEMNY